MSLSPGTDHSPRSWWSVVAGVAVVSSAFTTISILGVQRFYRRNKRHELDEEIRRATKSSLRQRSSGNADGHSTPYGQDSKQYNANDADEKKSADDYNGEPQVPKYLAALAASQEGLKHQSRPASPRSLPSTRSPLVNIQNELKRQSSLHLKPSLSAASSSLRAVTADSPAYDESLIREQLSRNYSFLGDEAMSKVRDAFVIVVGAGGVGSWCALMLLRSGVGKIRIIDFDQVSLSSLNRHACANLADVGRPKVTVCKEHFANIAPWAEVDAKVEIFRDSEADRLLGPFDDGGDQIRPTYIIDAIDNLNTKIDLLAYCYKNKVKCFSSMGAGAKADPGQIQVAELNMTAEDPLARRVRRGLRARGIWTGEAMSAAVKKIRRPRERESTVKASDIKAVPLVENQKREADHQAALNKLEANGMIKQPRRLTASGRGAVDNIELAETTVKADRSTESDRAETGFSRYSTSRRASSSSSMGSAQFYSPASTPDAEGSRSYEDLPIEAETHIAEAFTLGTAQKEEEDPEAQRLSEVTSDIEPPYQSNDVPQRPPLATLIDKRSSAASSDASGSRTSSLKELVAEDIRSSHAGEEARRSTSTLSPPVNVEEGNEVIANGDADDRPFKIMCVFSNEKSDTRLLPLDEEEFQKGKVEELATLEDFRVRILPVLGPLPAMFGLAAATYVLCDIAGKELETLPFKNRKKTYERVSIVISLRLYMRS